MKWTIHDANMLHSLTVFLHFDGILWIFVCLCDHAVRTVLLAFYGRSFLLHPKSFHLCKSFFFSPLLSNSGVQIKWFWLNGISIQYACSRKHTFSPNPFGNTSFARNVYEFRFRLADLPTCRLAGVVCQPTCRWRKEIKETCTEKKSKSMRQQMQCASWSTKCATHKNAADAVCREFVHLCYRQHRMGKTSYRVFAWAKMANNTRATLKFDMIIKSDAMHCVPKMCSVWMSERCVKDFRTKYEIKWNWIRFRW